MSDFWFDALFFVVPVFIFVIFIITIISVLSPKFRGKMMGRQIKATKYMLDDVQDDLAKIGSIAASTKQKVIKNNEGILKDIARSEADINKEGIEITARAIKDGFSNKKIYCKYCGVAIDEDSSFCKNCGKKL